jgi:hypothetical protein
MSRLSILENRMGGLDRRLAEFDTRLLTGEANARVLSMAAQGYDAFEGTPPPTFDPADVVSPTIEVTWAGGLWDTGTSTWSFADDTFTTGTSSSSVVSGVYTWSFVVGTLSVNRRTELNCTGPYFPAFGTPKSSPGQYFQPVSLSFIYDSGTEVWTCKWTIGSAGFFRTLPTPVQEGSWSSTGTWTATKATGNQVDSGTYVSGSATLLYFTPSTGTVSTSIGAQTMFRRRDVAPDALLLSHSPTLAFQSAFMTW